MFSKFIQSKTAYACFIFLLTIAGTSAANYFVPQKVIVQRIEEKVVVANTVSPIAIDEPIVYATGWVKDEIEVNKVLKTLKFKNFDETPATEIDTDTLPNDVFLWDYYRKVNGKLKTPKNQGQVGSCVSFGFANALEDTLCYEIVAGQNFKYNAVIEEIIYAGSRNEIGGGRLNGDGSVGAWAADFVKKYGILSRGQWLGYDLSVYSESRCREWGNSGVPDDLEPDVKKYPVGDAVLITTWLEAKKALAQGYAIAVCSDQGFTMQRDSKGVCYPQGTWPHCMEIGGYHIESNGKEYGYIQNSWGSNAHTGPVGWGNPNTGGFWAESSVINRMLSQRDSWAVSGVKGFPKRKLVWIKKPIEDVRPIKLNMEFALAW